MSNRILLVVPLPPPYGGISVQAKALYENLARANISVLVHDIGKSRRRMLWLPHFTDFSRIFALFKTIIIDKDRFDVMNIHANSYMSYTAMAVPAMILGKLLRKRIVLTYKGGSAPEFFSGPLKCLSRFMKLADAVTVQSEFLHNFLTTLGIRSSIIPNFLTLKPSEKPAAKPSDRFIILTNRNFGSKYRVIDAIEMFKKVADRRDDVYLEIAGDGPEKPFLKNTVRKLGLEQKVAFLGSLDRDAMAQALNRADIYVNPSSVDNMPNSIIEALAFSLPIVTTKVGGIPFIVEDEKTALMVDPENPSGMADAVLRLIESEELRERLCANAAEASKMYSPDAIIPIWRTVFSSVCRKP